MKNKYKIVISNRNLYHEVELPVDAKTYKIGTSIDCDFRLHKEYFFEDIRLDFTNENDNWYVMCSDNIYITTGDTRRLLTMELKHGDIIIVKYQESNNDVFDMEFMVDFDSKNINFERKIYLGNIPKVSIGAAIENDIVLLSSYIINDKIELSKRGTDVELNIIDSSYGVYHNGNKINDKQIIKNGDFISISDYVFYYKDNALWTEIENNYSIKNLTFMDYPVKNSYPMFVRNTRLKTAWDEEDIEILDSPEKPQKPENNLLMSLMPAMGMLIVSGIMSFMGGMMAVFGIISAIMAIITSIASIIQGNKDYKKQISERIEKYNIYIKNKREEIEKKQEEERELLNQIYISKEEKLNRFNEFSSDLFDRNKEDDDFIEVRLGIGSIKSTRKIKYKKQERLEIEDDLQKMPEDLCDEYEKLDDAPIVCDFKNMNALGITGHEKNRYELLKTIVFDIITRQFHFDVKMFFIVSEKDTSLIKNFRFLPHIDHTIENTKNIVCDEESKKVVFEFLYNELTKREQEKGYDEHYIIFFYDQCGFASHPISRFVNKAKELGVIFIFFSDEIAGIPMGCDKIISLINDSEAEIIDSEDVMGSSNFQYEKILDEEMSKIVQIMSAVETEEISLEGSLTKSISFFDMLNILGVEDLDLKKRWEATEVYKTMSVPIGVSKTETVYLDLHDKAHGPHGLVAGTTGSGKSEILQTYILSIATYFHPYEVAFVIIDFKGGGMVNQFKDLPHLLGSITNIEGKEIERSLKSIKAELQKRQRLFAETEVNHIDAYIRKFKLGDRKSVV